MRYIYSPRHFQARQETGREGVDRIQLVPDGVQWGGSAEHGNESSDSIGDYHFLKEESNPGVSW
jgi:hypothetical protein